MPTPEAMPTLVTPDSVPVPLVAGRRRIIDRRVRRWADVLLSPVAASAAVVALADVSVQGVVLVSMVLLFSGLVVPPPPAWASLLPLMKYVIRGLRAMVGVAGVALMQALTGLPGLTSWQLGVLFAITAVTGALTGGVPRRRWGVDGPIRTAVIGSERYARDLGRELAIARMQGYTVVGRISVDPAVADPTSEVRTMGDLSELRQIVEQNDIRLLVMTGEVPRFRVFDEISRTCLHLPVRLWELSGFYEDVFGHVAVADINASWFQYIMHPNYRAIVPAAKRLLDVVVAAVALLLALPLLAIVALVIRRDGPILFKQVRIGEGGRPLTVHKLRTMRVDAEPQAAWASKDDPRITRVGRLLRRTHLDELPQLINVLKGEMSLVGPRPEQPEFVDRLEESLHFYARRHLVKPGITGWAQVRCGYAGSDIGSAWKLAHDLYYIKHRSLAFDLAILFETLRTLVWDRGQYAVEPPGVSFIVPGQPQHFIPVPQPTSASATH